jgi:hypothetical protein
MRDPTAGRPAGGIRLGVCSLVHTRYFSAAGWSQQAQAGHKICSEPESIRHPMTVSFWPIGLRHHVAF